MSLPASRTYSVQEVYPLNQNFHDFHRGEIYYAYLEPSFGHEQGGTRPVLILQNDVGNYYSPTIIVTAATTQQHRKTSMPTHICESFSLRKTLERLQTDIDGIDREKFNRYEDYHAREISAEAFLDEKERLNLRQSALKEELSKTQLRYDKCVQQEESTHDERMTAKKLTLISDDELRVRMYALIDKITVYANDDITISWKFDAAFADEKNTAGSIA